MKEILIILLLQLIYVPCFTLRTIFLVKHLIVPASILGFVESLIYVFGLSLVFNGNQTFLGMLVYAFGFGLGILIGTKIEQKLAIGYTTFNVNLPHKNEELIKRLRNEGYGVTVFHGEGMNSERYKLEILTKRNLEEQLLTLIKGYESNAFIISYEPRRFSGGYILKNMRKNKMKK
ncbi:DUF2179 domain-containing protein [Bacillus sp. AGMB 02131]|uniref:UPF0316 protein IEO70_19235 n=1 Tax=Peribacillus faecalis TaxID=2772559 RepID=A0A927D0I3_9BACI|nr:DUF2179 domain-containing protein [Peribacillus faecalis]MBD3110464.1 DUF2179 domain-containing protein [Peribacillus faecalis]